jgi:hypothetical protein
VTQRGAIFKPETAAMILEVVRYLKNSGYIIDQPGRGGAFISPQTPIFVRNDSGEQVPAFACMQATGTVEDGGQNYIKIGKPVDTTGTAGAYLFNGVQPIDASGENRFGVAHDGPVVRALSNGSSATSGSRWQPVIGSWSIAPGGNIFAAIGGDDIASDVIRINATSGSGGDSRAAAIIKTGSGGIPERIGSIPGAASCSVYGIDGSGNLYDTTEDIAVYNLATTAVAANVYGQAKKESWTGKWVIDYEQCEEEA